MGEGNRKKGEKGYKENRGMNILKKCIAECGCPCMILNQVIGREMQTGLCEFRQLGLYSESLGTSRQASKHTYI